MFLPIFLLFIFLLVYENKKCFTQKILFMQYEQCVVMIYFFGIQTVPLTKSIVTFCIRVSPLILLQFLNYTCNLDIRQKFCQNPKESWEAHFQIKFLRYIQYNKYNEIIIFNMIWYIHFKNYLVFEKSGTLLQSFWKKQGPGFLVSDKAPIFL